MTTPLLKPTAKPRRLEPDPTEPERTTHGTAPIALPGLSHGPVPTALTRGPVMTDTEKGAENETAPMRLSGALTKLNADEILAVVRTSKYLRDTLESSTHSQRRAPQPEKMEARVRKVVAEAAAMFGDNPDAVAMSLAIAIDKVAAVIASEIYDPSLRPAIAGDLFDVYGPKLEAALKKKKVADPKDQVALAKVVASSDPVALFMHGEKRLEDAAFEIRDAAVAAKKKPLAMYTIFRQRFEAEMASYSTDEIDAQEHKASAYNLSESTGELSGAYFKRLFGDDTEATAKGGTDKKAKKQKGGLKFSAGATAQLDALKQEVLAAKPDSRPKNAKERRDQLFADVAKSDTAIKDMRERHVLETLMSPTWGLPEDKAKAVIARLKSPTGLAAIPLTVTHWADRRTQGLDDDPGKAKDESRAGKTTGVEMAKVIGKKHTKAKTALDKRTQQSSGKYEDLMYGEERGDRYLQFRGWKDRKMSGNVGMKGDEMPVFGAVNVNFDRYGGTSAVKSNDALATLKDKKKAGTKLTAEEQKLFDRLDTEHKRLLGLSEDDQYGINYYGDMHLKLKYDRVKDRVLYTATDHGEPHRDPFLAFADLLVGSVDKSAEGGEVYHSDRTGLKRKEDNGKPSKGVQKTPVAAAIISTVLGVQEQSKMELPFEIQIFGGVDWAHDVEEIWVSPGAPKPAWDRLITWQKQEPGRPPVLKMTRPKGIKEVSVSKQTGLAAAEALKLP